MPSSPLSNAEYSSYLFRGNDHCAHPAAIGFQGMPGLAKLFTSCYRPVYLGLLIYAINPFLTIAIGCYLATIGLVAMALTVNRKRDEQFSLGYAAIEKTLPDGEANEMS